MRRIQLVLLLGFAGLGCADSEPPPWDRIREELIGMERRDGAAREGLTGASVFDTALLREMVAVDSIHTARLREIIGVYGWPGVSDVGEDGAGAAWTLLQHSPDVEFQRETLPLMEDAAERGEASRRSLALLTDRVLIRQDQPQLYGTQFKFVEGGIEFHPIADPESVDARRASVGLPPLEEYRRMSEEFYEVGDQDTVRAPGGSS